MRRRTHFQCTIMRGGTSKGIFLMKRELPDDPVLRDRIVLAIFGSPDIRQIDGLGGADSLTSKLALISPPEGPDRDVDYTFGAVGIDRAFVDYSANCGNISSAVGPYAIERGLVHPEEPFTTVRIFNTNTRKMIHAKIPVRKGKVISDGDYAIDGVPGTGARIELSFMDPGGAATGSLLPTGKVVDELVLETGERLKATIVDAGNPTAFIRAEDINLTGTELPLVFDQDMEKRTFLEALRNRIGESAGIPKSPSIPKIVFVSPSRDYTALNGMEVKKEEVDVVARALAMGKMHKTFPITASIPAAIASILQGSIVNETLKSPPKGDLERRLVIGHPSGKFEVEVRAKQEAERVQIISCTIGRTARKIMEGKVFVSRRVYSSRENKR